MWRLCLMTCLLCLQNPVHGENTRLIRELLSHLHVNISYLVRMGTKISCFKISEALENHKKWSVSCQGKRSMCSLGRTHPDECKAFPKRMCCRGMDGRIPVFCLGSKCFPAIKSVLVERAVIIISPRHEKFCAVERRRWWNKLLLAVGRRRFLSVARRCRRSPAGRNDQPITSFSPLKSINHLIAKASLPLKESFVPL